MKLRLFLCLCLVTCFGAQFTAQVHKNVLIGQNNEPNEPSICFNPKYPARMVAGANIDNLYFSSDTGATWTQTPVTCTWGVWGDPVIGTDTTGHFLFLHLSNPPQVQGSWIDRIIAQKSTDGGITWSNGSYMGLNGFKAQDKHWIATDWKTNALYVTWTQFDRYGSTQPGDSSVILFSKSTDAGLNWTLPKRLNTRAGDCRDEDNTAEGAVPAVGPNGEVYVAWSNQSKIWFDKSLDGGNTWLNNDIEVSTQPGGWDYAVPGIYRANGLPVTTVDTSGRAHHGTIYINWTDQRNGPTDTDVWLVKSTDKGATWSTPVRVNDDLTKRHQFFTWMAVDQKTGWLWFVFYDRRNHTDLETDVYMAVSKDGGTTFQNFKVSETPFTPSSSFFFGDYTNVVAHNNIVRPIWTRLDQSALSVWTAMVRPDAVTAIEEPTTPAPESMFSIENPYPNPAKEETGFAFKLRKSAVVSVVLVDLQGNIKAVLKHREQLGIGKYQEKIETDTIHLSAGAYIILLNIDGHITRKKIVFID